MRVLISVFVFLLMVFSMNTHAQKVGQMEENLQEVTLSSDYCFSEDKKPHLREAVVVQFKVYEGFCWAWQHDKQKIIVFDKKDKSNKEIISQYKFSATDYGVRFFKHYFREYGGNPLKEEDQSFSSGKLKGNTDPDVNQF